MREIEFKILYKNFKTSPFDTFQLVQLRIIILRSGLPLSSSVLYIIEGHSPYGPTSDELFLTSKSIMRAQKRSIWTIFSNFYSTLIFNNDLKENYYYEKKKYYLKILCKIQNEEENNK